MPKRNLPFLLINILLICFHNSYGQGRFLTQQLDNRSGLSNSCINAIFQDSDHLLWIGTWDGLNLYNGSNVQVFNINKSDSVSSIANNVIYNITEDRDHLIWVNTLEGVSRYNKISRRFTHFFYEKDKVTNSIQARNLLARNNKGQIYVTTKGGTLLYVFNFISNRFEPIKLNIGRNHVSKMLFDNSDYLYMLLDNGNVYIYSTNNNQLRLIKPFSPSSKVSSLFFANKQIFCVDLNHTIYSVSANSGYQIKARLPHDVREINYWFGSYIISWSTKGLAEYDLSFKRHDLLTSQVPLLGNVRGSFIYPGADSILWIGTEGSGITQIVKKQNRFGLVQRLDKKRSFNIPVRAFCEVNGDVWVGSKGNGITIIKNIGTASESYSFMKSFHASRDIFDNCVYSIQAGTDNIIYIGSDAPGITLFNPKTQKTTPWYNIKGTSSLPYFNSVHCTIVDDDGSIWIGSESSGLIHLRIKKLAVDDFKIDFFKQYKADGTKNSLGNNVVYSLAKGSKNKLWIGCRYGGLSLLDKTTDKIQTFKAYNYESSLSNNDVLSLCNDKNNRLWIGTSYGLNWLSESNTTSKRPVFHKIDSESGLPNNTIHAIVQDDNGSIWASTNKGLVQIDSKDFKIIQFKESDGLQSNEFSDNAVYKSKDGIVFFGGIYGFNYFNPKQIQLRTSLPNILITNMIIAGESKDDGSFSVVKQTSSKPIGDYEVSRANNYFELKIKSIDLLAPEKCRYMYFLEGNDKTWHNLDVNNKILYSNIPPGHYSLKIKWSNGEGYWTHDITVLNLTVNQYLWLSLPAISLYIVICISAGYVFHLYRKNKLQMEHQLLMEHKLREKDEEMHQEQLNFFTNIAHELQSPLTIILGSLERFIFKNDQDKHTLRYRTFLTNANSETSRLQYLVYQLLEFRKAQAGRLENKIQRLNVSAFFKNIAALFDPLSEARNITFTCEIEDGIYLLTDKDKLEKIVFNLLSNAFKYCDPNQHIIFSLLRNNLEGIRVIVANSGCKISDHELPKLFERFFTENSSHSRRLSSGIGLAFSQELAANLNSRITAELKNTWIEFKLLLSNSNHENGYEIVTTDADPSYLMQSINLVSDKTLKTTAENNKNSLILDLSNPNKKKILIVEDEINIRFLLKDILENQYITYEVTNGNEAIVFMKNVIPDLIITDLMMPDMDGNELCTIIKNTPETCHIPVIMLTAKGTLEQKIEGYHLGADAYIAKPFNSEHLLVRIKRLFDYQEKLKGLFKTDIQPQNFDDLGLKVEDQSFLNKLVKLVEDNLSIETLDANFLESHLAMSKRDFYRKVKSCSNMTPAEFIKNIRLQRAANYLKTSKLTVSEIFYRTGFNNQSHFYREFKRKYNTSPNDYRAAQKLPLIKN